MERTKILRRIRVWLSIVILALFVSGVTALQHELDLVVRIAAHFNLAEHAPATQRVVPPGRPRPRRHQRALPIPRLWGLIASVGIFFLALIAGPIRGIPFYWRLIDCSFGVVCGAILLRVRALIQRLQISGL